MHAHDAFELETRLARTATAQSRYQDLVGVLVGDAAAERVATTGRLWPLLDGHSAEDLDLTTRMRLECLRELLGRLAAEPRAVGDALRTPHDVARAFAHLGALDHEQFHVAALDVKNRVLASRCLGSGDAASVSTDLPTALRFVLGARGVALLIVHNHPSGNPEPSTSDRVLTDEFFAGARHVGLRPLDHVIVGAGRCFSFVEGRTLDV